MQGKQIEDFDIDVINNIEPYQYSPSRWGLQLRTTKDDIEKPHESLVFPAGNYDQEHSWWLLFSGEDKNSGKPLNSTLAINAPAVSEDALLSFTDGKRYSDVELLLREFELYFRQDIERQFKQLNKVVALLPNKVKSKLDSVDSFLEGKEDDIDTLQDSIDKLQTSYDELHDYYNKFSWATIGMFTVLAVGFGGFAAFVLSRIA